MLLAPSAYPGRDTSNAAVTTFFWPTSVTFSFIFKFLFSQFNDKFD